MRVYTNDDRDGHRDIQKARSGLLLLSHRARTTITRDHQKAVHAQPHAGTRSHKIGIKAAIRYCGDILASSPCL